MNAYEKQAREIVTQLESDIAAALAAERERCARIVELGSGTPGQIAAAIRADEGPTERDVYHTYRHLEGGSSKTEGLAAERERLAIYHENKHDAIVRDLERGDITIEQGLKLAGQAAAHRESAAAIRALGDE